MLVLLPSFVKKFVTLLSVAGLTRFLAHPPTHTMLQVAAKSRRLATVLSQNPVLLNSAQVLFLNSEAVDVTRSCHNYATFSQSHRPLVPMCSMMMSKALFSSDATAFEGGATDLVKEVYDRMHKSVIELRSAPPNAWMWTLIDKCENREDVKLLFDILQHVRRFRLSNLRIHDNFNSNLCLEVTKACVRVGAIDFGKKALCKHNMYGLTPSVASAHALLLHAKQQNDANLMVDIMKLLKANDIPLQAGTADIVFRVLSSRATKRQYLVRSLGDEFATYSHNICYNTNKWDLISKYAKRFVKAGVTLRRTSFDTWMTFAAKQGDVDSLWKTEKLRSELMKTHTVASCFSCAKGFLLERKPDNAAAVIQALYQTLPDARRPSIMAELQKLASEWPLEVLKPRKEEEMKELSAALQDDIPAMVIGLSHLGLKVNVDTEGLTKIGLRS